MKTTAERIEDLIQISEYEKAANLFLSETNTKLDIKFKKKELMQWDRDNVRNIYTCTLTTEKGSYEFEFGDSTNNTKQDVRKNPTNYDVLACLSVSYFEDVDDIYDNLGEVKPSIANAIYEQEQELIRLFSDDEIELLNEIA